VGVVVVTAMGMEKRSHLHLQRKLQQLAVFWTESARAFSLPLKLCNVRGEEKKSRKCVHGSFSAQHVESSRKKKNKC
jgi:hypothetical protein